MTEEEQIEREMNRAIDELEQEYDEGDISTRQFNDRFREIERAAREELADLES